MEVKESKRSGERLPKAAQRVNAVNQFAGFLGLTGSRCQRAEFFDIIKKLRFGARAHSVNECGFQKKKTPASELASVSLF